MLETTPRLNYCYLKIIHIFGACLIQKKSKQKQFRGVVGDILFWKPPQIFFTMTLEIPDKTKLNPWIIQKIVLDPLEIPRPQKQRPLEILHYFFLVTIGNSSFLINPQKFHMLFLWYPWKSHISSTPLFRFFHAIKQFNHNENEDENEIDHHK